MCTSLPEQNRDVMSSPSHTDVMRCPSHLGDVMRMRWLRNPEVVMEPILVLEVNVMRISHLKKVDVMELYVMESPNVTGVLRMIYGQVR